MKHYLNRIVFCTIVLIAAIGQAQDYRIGEGDVIKVSVYDNPDLAKVDRVSNEGLIVIPLIGPVTAKGRTVAELSKTITTLLADGYLVDPHVSVYVEEFNSRVFYVNGEVKNPDVFKHQDDMTVIKAITLANGFTPKASPNNVKIIRNINGKKRIFEKVKMDMPVLPDDILVVPESFF